VFAGPIDSGERLLVDEAGEAVLVGDALEGVHHQMLVVGGHVGALEDGRDFELAGGDLVVPCLGRDPELEQFPVDFVHVGHDPLRNDPEVVVLEFLALRRGGPEHGPSGGQQVGAGEVEGLVDEEILLFRTGGGGDPADVGMAEEPENPLRLDIQGLHRFQDGGLLVQDFSRPRDVGSGDAQGGAVGILQEVGRAGGIPGGVAAGGMGGAESSAGEGRGVGLSLDQGFPFELGDRRGAVRTRVVEAVVLFRGGPGQGVEDVTEMGCAAADGPGPHGVRHFVGDGRIKRGLAPDGGSNLAEHFRTELLLHHRQTEDVRTEDLSRGSARVVEGFGGFGAGQNAPDGFHSCNVPCHDSWFVVV
jgi:hypothetical protein